MKSASVLIIMLIGAACSSCDDNKTTASNEKIAELEQNLKIMQAEIKARDLQITKLEDEKTKAIQELENTKGTLVKEIRDRLEAMESDHATAVESDALIVDTLKMLTEAEAEFFSEAKSAAERHKEFKKIMQNYHPIWASTSGKDWGNGIKEALVELHTQNAALTKELEALKGANESPKSVDSDHQE